MERYNYIECTISKNRNNKYTITIYGFNCVSDVVSLAEQTFDSVIECQTLYGHFLIRNFEAK